MEVWSEGWCLRYPWDGSCSCVSTATEKHTKSEQLPFCPWQQTNTYSNPENVMEYSHSFVWTLGTCQLYTAGSQGSASTGVRECGHQPEGDDEQKGIGR